MCSIIGAYKHEDVKQLVELNQFRGNFSHSITTITDSLDVIQQEKGFGPFNYDLLTSDENYHICHVQAPTGGLVKDINRIHPVREGSDMLWHNGLLTSRGVKLLQTKLNTEETFDTLLLFKAIKQFGFDILSEIEGLFSCVLILNHKLYMFRTKHGKLHIDDQLNISSERFKGAKCINFDTIYEVDFENSSIIPVNSFKTKRFNIIVDGEY